MSIRTTATFDDDVYARLKAESGRRGVPFRQTLNDVLREGLVAAARPKPRKRFVVHAQPMGLHPGLNYDNIEALIEYAEGPEHR